MADNHPRPLPHLSEKDVTRFWSKVDKRGPDDCWPWLGGSDTAGYGHFHITDAVYGKSTWKAHRIAHLLYHGKDPHPLLACHRCDSPRCCNGSHTFPGTTRENAEDMLAKGRAASGDRSFPRLHPERMPRGERNGAQRHPEKLARGNRNGARLHPERVPRGERSGMSKLTTDNVMAIRQLHTQGQSSRSLAKQFMVDKATIKRLIRRDTWKHVP